VKASSHQITEVASYQPRMDWWVALIVLVIIFGLVLLIPLFLWSSIPHWQGIAAALAMVLGVLYLVDSCFFTRYQLHENGLAVDSQLRHFFFPYRSMVRIEPKGFLGLISFWRFKRFALSSRCYAITLRGQLWTQITLSPSNTHQFIEQLLHNIDTERSSRATDVRIKR
jgi:hypothetical protein